MDLKRKRKISRIIVVIAFILILVIAVIVSDEKLLEFLFVIHKKVLVIMGILFIGKELWDFIKKYKNGIVDKFHLVWSLVFFVLLFANIAIFEMIVCPKLSKIEILYPENNEEIAGHMTDVEISVRCVKNPLFIVVKTPQRTLWSQIDKLKTEEFKDKLKGKAQLGELALGINRDYEIFAIATKEDLPIGVLERIPPDAIYSNTVNVKRVR